MNVLFVTNAYHPIVGGVEKAAARLASELKKLDCEVEIVTARNPFSLPPKEIIDGVPVYRLPYYVYRDSLKSAIATLIGMPIACGYLLRMAVKRKPCIVHVHFIYHNAVCVELIRGVLKKQGIPIVVTFHGGDAPNIPVVYSEKNPSESKILDWAAARLINGADALTAVSNSLKQSVVSKIPEGKGDIQVIHNGVDTDLFVPGEKVKERKAILSIGRLSYAKGFDILFHSFYELAGKFPGWELRVAGDGELRASLENLVKSLNLQERVHFLGMLQTEDLIEEIHSAAFIASASRWEGFSLGALEGLSCGKPLVTTDVEGSEEMVIEGITGRIVPKEDPAALTEAMRNLMEKPETRQEMGRQARRFMLEHYTWDKVANKYLDLYSTLIRQ